jgi:hypothetical protein
MEIRPQKPGAGNEKGPMSELVTVGVFATPEEAHICKNRLETDGIDAQLVDAETVGMAWYYASALGGVKVQVRAEQMEEAQRVLELDEPVSSEDIDVEETPLSDECWEEDRLKSSHVEEATETESPGDACADRAFRAAVFGMIALPPLLHLYSLYLLVRLDFSELIVSPRATRRVRIAWVIDVIFISLAVLFFARMWYR